MNTTGRCRPRMRPGARGKRFSALAAIVLLLALGSPLSANGQRDADRETTRGRFFLGSAFLVSSTLGAPEDPAGFGFLRPNFHGSVDTAAVGGLFNGGVRVGRDRDWSIGAEVVVRRAQSATISEETRSRFEFWRLTPLYTERERLVSVIARVDALSRARVTVQPLGGLTLSRISKTLTDRRGLYEFPGGQRPIERPDLQSGRTAVGLVGGADFLFHVAREAAIVTGVRAHWVPRYEPPLSSREPDLPSTGPWVIQFSAGLRWSPGSG